MQLKFRTAIILILINLLSASITACNAETRGSSDVTLPVLKTNETNTQPTASDLCKNILYPTTQGAFWVYASVGGPNGMLNYINSITEARADGFTLTSQFNNVTRTQKWSCTPEGLIALQPGGGNAAGISIQDMTAELTTSEVKGISIPQTISTGMEWQYGLRLQGTVAMPGDQKAQSNGSYFVNMKALEKETVTVPAGTFEAIKIQSNSAVDIMAVFEGMEVPVKFNGITITWYVPGIGYVKSVENGDFGGTIYSTTTELQSYKIP
jgi:hypothetical protein